MSDARKRKTTASAQKTTSDVAWPFSSSGYLHRIPIEKHVKDRVVRLSKETDRPITSICRYFIERCMGAGDYLEFEPEQDVVPGRSVPRRSMPYLGMYCPPSFWRKIGDYAWEIPVKRQSAHVFASLAVSQQIGKYPFATWKEFLYNGGDILDRMNNYFLKIEYARSKPALDLSQFFDGIDSTTHLPPGVPPRDPESE